MTPEYEQGYRDGMNHLSQQMEHLNSQVVRMAELLSKAAFVRKADEHPKPNMHIWLILDEDMVTSGYFTGKEYLADSGVFVNPKFWCMIPKIVTGENLGPRRRIVKPD